ncbi:MAG: transglycosylase SLT domain-containing protein [Alphaproteobacteria bacterium]|nr:transglycosylase SLT domain-containing protein [Alphaproteobacteria bacterium]MCW5739038.1 transglycosylase SLT domain-containing protein [Alphaproteobacteria bacterium]
MNARLNARVLIAASLLALPAHAQNDGGVTVYRGAPQRDGGASPQAPGAVPPGGPRVITTQPAAGEPPQGGAIPGGPLKPAGPTTTMAPRNADAVAQLVGQARPLPAETAAGFAAILKALDETRLTDAREHARAMGNALIVKYVEWAILRHPRSTDGFAAAAAFLRANPDWPDDAPIRRQAEDRLDGDTPPAEIVAFFKDFPPLTSAGHMRRIEAIEAAAPKEIANVARESWHNATFRQQDEAAFLAHYGAHLRPSDHFARFDRLMREGRDKVARELLPRLSPPDMAVAEARLAMATRAPEVTAMLRVVPADRQVDHRLMFERLRWLRRTNDQAGARQLLLTLNPSVQQDEDWWVERQYHVRESLQAGRAAEAYKLAVGHGLKRGAGFAEAEFLAGWIALRWLKRPDDALRHFKTLDDGVSTPISKSRAAYWLGRAHEAKKRPLEAAGAYERAAQHGQTYYGQLAAKRLPNRAPLMPSDPEATPAERDGIEKREIVTLARWLAQVGEDERARPFLLRVGRIAQSAGELALSAAFAIEAGRPDVAVSISRRAVESGVALYEAAYPVVDLGNAGSIERALVLGLTRQESGFQTGVSSSAGALGLMQLMPGTARAMAAKTRQPFDVARLTSDPAYNVSLGAQYLADMLERFGGSYELALSAYNAGPNRTARWLESIGDPRNGAIDMVDWIELIPFRETRNYVQRVMEAVVVYRDRLNGPFRAVAAPRR